MSGEDFLRLVDTLGVEVAERHDLDPVDVGEAFHGARAAAYQPDETHAYDRDRVDRQPQNGMLALGTGRDVEYDHAVDDAVTLRGGVLHPQHSTGCAENNKKANFFIISGLFSYLDKSMKYF